MSWCHIADLQHHAELQDEKECSRHYASTRNCPNWRERKCINVSIQDHTRMFLHDIDDETQGYMVHVFRCIDTDDKRTISLSIRAASRPVSEPFGVVRGKDC